MWLICCSIINNNNKYDCNNINIVFLRILEKLCQAQFVAIKKSNYIPIIFPLNRFVLLPSVWFPSPILLRSHPSAIPLPYILGFHLSRLYWTLQSKLWKPVQIKGSGKIFRTPCCWIITVNKRNTISLLTFTSQEVALIIINITGSPILEVPNSKSC